MSDFVVVVSGEVATEPMKGHSVEAKVHQGFARPDKKVSLVPLKVVLKSKLKDGALIDPGVIVFVRGETYTRPWAKSVYQKGDLSFILVPASDIVLFDSEEYVNDKKG